MSEQFNAFLSDTPSPAELSHYMGVLSGPF